MRNDKEVKYLIGVKNWNDDKEVSKKYHSKYDKCYHYLNRIYRKEEILKELENIDKKSIRALREADNIGLEEYENKAIQLRQELKAINGVD